MKARIVRLQPTRQSRRRRRSLGRARREQSFTSVAVDRDDMGDHHLAVDDIEPTPDRPSIPRRSVMQLIWKMRP